MDVLAWLESTWPARQVAESLSIWGYPTILTLHTMGMGIVAGLAAVIALRFLGVGRGIPVGVLKTAYPVIWTGFTINLSSGLALFLAGATRIGSVPVFWLKMLLVISGIGLTLLLRRFAAGDAGEEQQHALGPRVVAVVSLLCWAGAITLGRLVAYLS